jgi:hypothetical protein
MRRRARGTGGESARREARAAVPPGRILEERAMRHLRRDSGTAAKWASLFQRARAALLHLEQAHHYSGVRAKDPWQFGVEMTFLLAAGLTVSDLRWLVDKGYLEHAVETTTWRHRHRAFRHVPNLAFAKRSCFLLTPAGLAALEADAWGASDGHVGEGQQQRPQRPEAAKPAVPRWDADAHTLSWREQTWQFRHEAPHLEAILAAFQQGRWARCVRVTLESAGGCPKASLHNAVKNLNRKVRHSLHFAQEGNGTRVSWQPLKHEPQ